MPAGMAAYGQKCAGRCRERFRSPLGTIPESPAERELHNVVALDALEKRPLPYVSEYYVGSKHIIASHVFSHFSLVGGCRSCMVLYIRREFATGVVSENFKC